MRRRRWWRWWCRAVIRTCIWRSGLVGCFDIKRWGGRGRCGWRGVRQGGEAAGAARIPVGRGSMRWRRLEMRKRFRSGLARSGTAWTEMRRESQRLTSTFRFPGIKTAGAAAFRKGMGCSRPRRSGGLGLAHTERATAEADCGAAGLRVCCRRRCSIWQRVFRPLWSGGLMQQTFAAVEAVGARAVLVTGGVAANAELRRRFTDEADRRGVGGGISDDGTLNR